MSEQANLHFYLQPLPIACITASALSPVRSMVALDSHRSMNPTANCAFEGSKLCTPLRKHLTRGFLCAVLDLSGILSSLLIPESSGIKRRGTPFPGLRNPGISHYGDKYPLPFYEPYDKK